MPESLKKWLKRIIVAFLILFILSLWPMFYLLKLGLKENYWMEPNSKESYFLVPDELKAPELSELGTVVAYYHDAGDGPKSPMSGVRIIYNKSSKEVTDKLTNYFISKGFRESQRVNTDLGKDITYYSISFDNSDPEQPIVEAILIYEW